MFLQIVVGAFVAAALGGWAMHRAAKSADRAEQDAKYRRRLFYRGSRTLWLRPLCGNFAGPEWQCPASNSFRSDYPPAFCVVIFASRKAREGPPRIRLSDRPEL